MADVEDYPNPNVRVQSVFQPNFAEDRLPTPTRDGNVALVRALESMHPHYEEFHLQWGDWYNWYAGKGIEQYIFQHYRERSENFRKRRARAYYYNYTGSIVDLIAGFLYSKTVSRTFFRQDERLAQQEHIEKNDFWMDCDLRKTSINEFMQKVFIFTQIWGFVDVVVDMPRMHEEIVNEQQRLDASIRPYLYYILPTNMLNWEVDDKGEFYWVRWVERVDKQLDPFSPKPPVKIWRYTTWTRSEWFIHTVTQVKGQRKIAALIDAGEHQLGVVPVVRFYGKRDLLDQNQGQSFVEPIGRINVDIANSISLLTEEIRSKVFNILVLEDPNALGDAEGSAAGSTGVEIGNNNALMWAGSHPPYYLAPASDPGQFILQFVQKSTDEIYKLATLWTDTGIRESRSGVSYSYEFNRTNSMLADKAQLMEEGEIAIHRLYTLWLGETWEGLIDYPDSYDVEVLEQELLTTTQAKNAVRSQTFKRELEKRVARKVLNNSTTDVLESIMHEIDTQPEQLPIDSQGIAQQDISTGRVERATAFQGQGG
jgi:hypothetical protein